MVRDVVILAMSSKYREYCVAGIDIKNGNWVRLVSDDEETHGALTKDHVRYANGQLCQPLDVIRLEVLKDVPFEHQSENVMINPNCYWTKIGSTSLEAVLQLHPVENHATIFGNQFEYIMASVIQNYNINYSLIIVRVNNLTIRRTEYNKIKATFEYRGIQYNNMSVTDSDFFNVAIEEPFFTENAVIVMSIPDAPYEVYGEERYYKFVAKVFPIY